MFLEDNAFGNGQIAPPQLTRHNLQEHSALHFAIFEVYESTSLTLEVIDCSLSLQPQHAHHDEPKLSSKRSSLVSKTKSPY